MKRIILSVSVITAACFAAAPASAQIAAPGDISGKTIIAIMSAPNAETEILTFGDATFTQTGPQSGYGDYSWTRTDAGHGVLMLTNQEPGTDFGDVSTVDLAFKNNYAGSITGQVVFAGSGSKLLKGSFAFDITRPTLGISSPKPGAKWSNSVLTVTGKAADKVGVAKVWCQLNTGGWLPATGTTNWSATVPLLTPGTNTLAAYADDTSGNHSLTNRIKFNYLVPAALTLQIVGQGTVTPNDNGKLLAINNNYTLKAAAAKGFGFSYWSGGVPMTTASTLNFTMASNLTIIANFKDAAKPVVKITSPAMNLKWSGTNITVTGTAGDNVGVTGVGLQLNNGGWTAAQSANGYTNWTATNLPVVTGPNVLQAYAVDKAGNASLTNVIKFTGVSASGPGFAPKSLSGYAGAVKPTGGGQSIAMTWGDDTWAQTGTSGDTNADDYCAGTYTYVLTGPNTAVMTNVDIGMMSWLGTTNVTTVNLTFTSATSGSYFWTCGNDSGSGTIKFSNVKNLVPASVAGRTAHISVKGTQVTNVGFDTDGTFKSSVVLSSTTYTSEGTYTFTQFSPTVAVLKRVWTAPANIAGDVEYAEVIFTSANSGDIFGSYYKHLGYASNPDVVGLGTFTAQ